MPEAQPSQTSISAMTRRPPTHRTHIRVHLRTRMPQRTKPRPKTCDPQRHWQDTTPLICGYSGPKPPAPRAPRSRQVRGPRAPDARLPGRTTERDDSKAANPQNPHSRLFASICGRRCLKERRSGLKHATHNATGKTPRRSFAVIQDQSRRPTRTTIATGPRPTRALSQTARPHHRAR